MTIKVIIFDFDGTLADTLDVLVRITNRLAIEFGYKPTAREELDRIRNMSSREIVARSGVSLFKIPFLLNRVKEDLREEIQHVHIVPGIKEALIQLKHEGHNLGILTSNSEENVRSVLKQNGMHELFSFVYSETTLFSKHRILKKFINKNHLKTEEVIYVGDETRDIEASKRIRIKVVAVSWGFNSREALAHYNPDFLIQHPSELIEVMSNLEKISV
ncbi:MAG TPA: HAD-IA family hydrolase [Chroococcales cyanobacterium]|jgi:phosphoglycolate phosphatase-like HAD superfamily hydrolase